MATGYENGGHPVVGDRVQHVSAGRIGKITNVNLDAGNTPGHDQVSVEWDDGGGIGMALAIEFRLINRNDKG